MKVEQFGTMGFRIRFGYKDQVTYNEDAIQHSDYPTINVFQFVKCEMFDWLEENCVERERGIDYGDKRFLILFNEHITYGALRYQKVKLRYRRLFDREFIIVFNNDTDAVHFKLRWFNV